MSEPRTFRSDGPEPPSDVHALVDLQTIGSYRFLVRKLDGWAWSVDALGTAAGDVASWAIQASMESCELREVAS